MGDVPFSVVLGPPPGSYVAERLAGLIEGWDRWQRCGFVPRTLGPTLWLDHWRVLAGIAGPAPPSWRRDSST
jgi:hypothetical protein